MTVAGGTNGVDGHRDVAGGAVFEAHRHRQAAGQLPMNLALHGTRADGAEADQVGVVLAESGIQKLGGRGQSHRCYIQQYLAGEMKALVDVETAVQVRVVDKALPSHHRSRLLEIYPEYREQGVSQWFNGGIELSRVVEQRVGIVHRTGPNDYQ